MSQSAILLLNFACNVYLPFFVTRKSRNLQGFYRKTLQPQLNHFSPVIPKKLPLSFFIFLSITFLSCNQNKNNPDKQELPSNDSTVFFPVREYFISQIQSVDSSSPAIKRFMVVNGQKDSALINTQQFDKIAGAFLENDIADKSVKKYYRQSVFQDQTTQSITFNYTTVNSSLPVQSLDILLDTTTQEVKRVFISKMKKVNDSIIIEKLNWKTNSSFLISRSIQLPSNKETTERISVVWGDNN